MGRHAMWMLKSTTNNSQHFSANHANLRKLAAENGELIVDFSVLLDIFTDITEC